MEGESTKILELEGVVEAPPDIFFPQNEPELKFEYVSGIDEVNIQQQFSLTKKVHITLLPN